MRLGKSNLSAVEKITIVLMNLLHLPISALSPSKIAVIRTPRFPSSASVQCTVRSGAVFVP